MFCGECGTKNKNGALFCENCGAKIEGAKEVTIKEKKPLTKKSKLIIAIVSVVAVIVIGLCIFLGSLTNPKNIADKILFTGMIDQYFDYKLGTLEYRSLRFETEVLDTDNYQGNAVVNYNEYEIPYTRIIEHKHFEYGTQPKTVITREYPATWTKGDEPYYPMNDEKNNTLYAQYKELADKEGNVIFGGRLGMYKYFDMDKVIEAALQLAEETI